MTAHVLISGSIFREPQQRTSQAGPRFVVATIKPTSTDNSGGDFWSIMCFSESAGAELLRLGLNEKLAVQGSLKLEIFEKDGQARISRTIFADHVLALRAPPKEKKPKVPPVGSKAADAIVKRSIDQPDATPEETAAGGPAFFSDDIPFEAAR